MLFLKSPGQEQCISKFIIPLGQYVIQDEFASFVALFHLKY